MPFWFLLFAAVSVPHNDATFTQNGALMTFTPLNETSAVPSDRNSDR